MREWDNFYVIVGSAAAALTGLQFVVMALVSDLHRPGTRTDIDAFGTPTILHFSAVLLVSAVVCAPWPNPTGRIIALTACGAGGVIYGTIVARRARRAQYRPVTEDWIWHVILPLTAYASLVGASAELLAAGSSVPPFVVGGASLLLLFVGIHNAWDTVTYIVVDSGSAQPAPRDEGAAKDVRGN
jgi:hypothetical protein